MYERLKTNSVASPKNPTCGVVFDTTCCVRKRNKDNTNVTVFCRFLFWGMDKTKVDGCFFFKKEG